LSQKHNVRIKSSAENDTSVTQAEDGGTAAAMTARLTLAH